MNISIANVDLPKPAEDTEAAKVRFANRQSRNRLYWEFLQSSCGVLINVADNMPREYDGIGFVWKLYATDLLVLLFITTVLSLVMIAIKMVSRFLGLWHSTITDAFIIYILCS
jgi:hypothetical protein